MPLAQYHQSRIALGSDTTLVIVTDQAEENVERIFAKLWLTIYRFEQQFSRFLPTSELSRFNQQAGLEVPISSGFYDILRAAKRLAIRTDGLYNPFILPALQRVGYLRSAVSQYTNDVTPDFRERNVVGVDKLSLSPEKASIPYGTALDLGGCGKGYLADLLTKLPLAHHLNGYWFSLGGDIVGRGADALGQPWQIYIQDAQHPEKNLTQTFAGAADGFAVATSGTIVHGERTGKRQWHHLIDPRTNEPANTDILLGTVMHHSATEADVLASCAVMLGTRHAETFLREHGVHNAILQTASKAHRIIHLDTNNTKKLQEMTV